MEFSGISVVILSSPRSVGIRALVELSTVLKHRPDALISFATGATFEGFYHEVEVEAAEGRLDLSRARITHLDEFVGFTPQTRGGFVRELLDCAPIRLAYEEGRFLPVPSTGEEAELRDHEVRIREQGGVQLQFLGIGANGHIAFAEPGTPLDRGFHRARLTESTRSALQPRFAPDPVPEEAVTAGPANVLQCARLVLVATGAGKAKAVRDMMDGDVTPRCPASAIRRHPDVLVLLDSAAAGGLDWPEVQSVAYR